MIDCTDEGHAISEVASNAPPRPYIGVHFECCGVYARIYRDQADHEYHGRCPNCLRVLRVRVGPDGVQTRLFRAT